MTTQHNPIFDNKNELDKALSDAHDNLTIGIVYGAADGGLLRVSDNAMGMSYDELVNALRVGFPPKNTSGRSKYGMGMKTASCWIGNKWTVTTKRLGEEVEHSVTVDVNKIANGDNDLNYSFKEGKGKTDHYTVIEIKEHNQVFSRSHHRQDQGFPSLNLPSGLAQKYSGN